MDRKIDWPIIAMIATLVAMVVLTSCASPEIYFAREQARETAYLKRIAADTLPRAPYAAPITPYHVQPYYINPWYYGINRSYYNGSVRYVVPFKRKVKRVKSKRYGNRNNNSYHSRSSINRGSNKKATIRRTKN